MDNRVSSQQVKMTRRICESAILIALAFILSFIKIPVGPTTTVSLASMLPIIILAYKYGPAWGILCGFVDGILQMIEGGIDAPPTPDILNYFLVVMLDYLLAFAALGVAGCVRNLIKNPSLSISLCSMVGIFARFLCSFTSGVIIWGVYAPEGQSPFLYSLVVNGVKFGLDAVLTIIIAAVLFAVPLIQKQTQRVNCTSKIKA